MERSCTTGDGAEGSIMAEIAEKYRSLNPFVQCSVGENVIWGADENGFCDVESINEAAFKTLLNDINFVSSHLQTRARFLVGAAGTGKSHLFARLRRKLPKGQFTFVANPPAAVPHIKRFILKKVISGMTRPVMGGGGSLPFSQLQRMVYFLLKRILTDGNLTVRQIHSRWRRTGRSKRDQILERLVKHLAGVKGLEIPLHVRRVLVRVLDDEKRDLAASWLSGTQSLTETDYKCLDVTGPLADDEISDLMKQLGHLSIETGPIVLILDQLDSLAMPDQIREIESLMIDLNDSSRNWYVVVSLLQAKFDFWFSKLSDPFKLKFGTVAYNSTTLNTAELSALSREQKSQLIQARLATPALRLQRKSDDIDDPYYPLSKSAVQQLASSDISNARILIQKGLEAYASAVTGKERPAITKLLDFVNQLFADLRAELEEADLAVDTASMADRVGELFRLLLSARPESTLTMTAGPLHTELDKFEGVDRVYAFDEKAVRVVHYDVQKGVKFPNVLKKTVNAQPSTILIRDGRVGVSGKATKEGLDLFQKDKKFFHLSLDQVRNLHALGNLLAKMREGEFDNADTEPKPSEKGVYECLAQNPDLVETDLAQALLVMSGLVDQPEPAQPQPEPVPLHPPNYSIVAELERIMERERWMSFERLCARVSSAGISADPRKVSDCLTATPLCNSVLIYPLRANLLESIGIVIWNSEG
jgi:hypothetical protein